MRPPFINSAGYISAPTVAALFMVAGWLAYTLLSALAGLCNEAD